MEAWQLLVLAGALGLYAAGALAALLLHQSARAGGRIAGLFTVLAGTALMAGAVPGLSGRGAAATLVRGYAPFTDITVRADAFSAYFLLLIGGVGIIVALYAQGYLKEYEERGTAALLQAGMPLFLLAMAGVVLAGNVFTFLVAWETMSVVSFLLVVYEHDRPEARRAGFIYVVMTHIGTAFLTVAFFMLGHHAGSFDFAQIAQARASLPGEAATWIYLFALIGFGTKAGLVPLHIWLPRAHPSAPSHISALMSGVMLKTAIYGFLLATLRLLPAGPLWWGVAAAVIGGNTALFGVMHGLGEIDQKRMLAYSSVENMGLLFMGIGTALVFRSAGHPYLAAFALVAVFFHAANHAVFKTLLFLGAGAVHTAVHTKNMNRLGGLIRKMPWTALFMLAGALAIAAMPPMNGFVGEWLLMQALFQLGVTGNSLGLHLLGALLIALLALIGALAVFLMIRFFAMSFLALPRSPEAERAHEVSLWMRAGMGIPAVLCLAMGVFPYAVYEGVRPAVEALIGNTLGAASFAWHPAVADSGSGHAAFGIVALAIACGFAAAWLIARAVGGKTRTVREATWACGIELLPRMTYTASGLSKPIRVAFGRLLKPSRSLLAVRNPRNPAFVDKYVYASRIPPIVEDFLYRPVMRGVIAGASLFRKIQNGVVQSYLLYLFATLVLILVWVMGR